MENVVCIHKDIVRMIVEGYIDLDVISCLTHKAFRILPREEAEHSDEWVHLITYLFCTDFLLAEPGSPVRVLAYQRCGAEERLKGKWSIGIGGHITEDDYRRHLDFEDEHNIPLKLFATASKREICEELPTESEGPLDPFTFIYMDDTDVNKVHLGLTAEHLLSRNFDIDHVDTSEIGTPCMCTLDELKERVDDFEDWSKYLIQKVLPDYF